MRPLRLLPFFLLLAGCAAPQKPVPIFATVPSGELQWLGETPVLHLSGTPYEMGYQHGMLMRREARASVENILASADRHLQVPGLGRLVARRKLDRAWKRMKPHVPDRYLEEMQGLADGAGIPLRKLQQAHALPEVISPSGAGFDAAEALIVYKPRGRQPFVNIGWLGFIGVLSGVNRQGISVAQTGEGPGESDLGSIPMPFLTRRVLEESSDLEQAARIAEGASPASRRRFTLVRMDQKRLKVDRRGKAVEVDLEELFSR